MKKLCQSCLNEVPKEFDFCKECADEVIKNWPIGWAPNSPKIESYDEVNTRFKCLGFGYNDPKPRYWRVLNGENEGMVGMEVGRYWHSCHIDSTELIVLLFIDNAMPENTVKDYVNFFLTEIK